MSLPLLLLLFLCHWQRSCCPIEKCREQLLSAIGREREETASLCQWQRSNGKEKLLLVFLCLGKEKLFSTFLYGATASLSLFREREAVAP